MPVSFANRCCNLLRSVHLRCSTVRPWLWNVIPLFANWKICKSRFLILWIRPMVPPGGEWIVAGHVSSGKQLFPEMRVSSQSHSGRQRWNAGCKSRLYAATERYIDHGAVSCHRLTGAPESCSSTRFLDGLPGTQHQSRDSAAVSGTYGAGVYRDLDLPSRTSGRLRQCCHKDGE